MSSQKTEHYELNQWLATDQVLRTDFNADNAKIDGVLAGLEARITALEGTAQSAGNCQIYYRTYSGNGSASRSFSFSRTPWLVMLQGAGYTCVAIYGRSSANCLAINGSGKEGNATWSGATVQFSFMDADYCCNHSGSQYTLVAFMPVDG